MTNVNGNQQVSYYFVPASSSVTFTQEPPTPEGVSVPKIKKIVVYNNVATVVFWKDGTQTKVVKGKNEAFDLEKAVAMCVAKKFYGSYEQMLKSLSRVKYQQDGPIENLDFEAPTAERYAEAMRNLSNLLDEKRK